MNEKERIKKYDEMVKGYYDVVTKGYRDVWGSDYFHPYLWPEKKSREEALEHTHEYIFKKADLPGSARVADYGCGIGAFTELLARKYENVTSLNFNKKQLRAAEKRIKDANITNVTFVEADIMKSSFEDEFDAVFYYDVAPHIPDKEKALKIIHRALKPGGLVIMTEWLVPPQISLAAKMLLVERFNDTWAFPYLENDRNYRGYFKKIGFDVVAAEDWSKQVGKSIHQGYDDTLKVINKISSVKGVAEAMDIVALLQHPLQLSQRARDLVDMVLYARALYDSGNFRYWFYVARKA
jgi:ubiquinone/menaquinone biosynthesis C-methylase UbiE